MEMKEAGYIMSVRFPASIYARMVKFKERTKMPFVQMILKGLEMFLDAMEEAA